MTRYMLTRLVMILFIVLGVVIVRLAFDSTSVYAHQEASFTVLAEHDDSNNHKPVARFTTNKRSYASGEPVIYTNLSYDLDAEPLAFQWDGKQEAFFEPGTYTITLLATDPYGAKSEPYSKSIVITNEPYLDVVSYEAYYGEAGKLITLSESEVDRAFSTSTVATYTASYSGERVLVMSDSPEQITKPGLLYREVISGKARLYLNHINQTKQSIDVAILLENKSDEPVHVATTAAGHPTAAKYPMLLGHIATSQLLLDDYTYPLITLMPGQQYVYELFSQMDPQDVAHSIYDVESTGQLQVSFIAITRMEQLYSFQWNALPFNGHLRGTFPSSHRNITVELQTIEQRTLEHIVIGDGQYDRLQLGYDTQSAMWRELKGNFGVTYQIKISNAARYSVFAVARGGAYKGSFLVDRTYVSVPQNGILPPKNSIVKIAQTAANADELNIEFIVPAGSSLPIILFFYPLDLPIPSL